MNTCNRCITCKHNKGLWDFSQTVVVFGCGNTVCLLPVESVVYTTEINPKMSQNEKTAQIMEKHYEYVLADSSPDRAKQRLIDAGILNKDGTVAEPYKDVIIPKEKYE